MCDFSRHDEATVEADCGNYNCGTVYLIARSASSIRDADVHSPEMAHFSAQNIIAPCELFSEN
jgi:hypothetical protein